MGKRRGQVTVIGLGLFGSTLAMALAEAEKEVIGIDRETSVVDALADSRISLVVRMDATDRHALIEHGVQDSEAAVVAITGDFEATLLIAHHLRGFGIPRIIARVATPLQREVVAAFGLEEVILPEEDAASRLARRLGASQVLDHIKLLPGWSVEQVGAPGHFAGRSVADIDLRRKYNLTLLTVRRPKTAQSDEVVVNLPGGDYIVAPGDILVLAGPDEALAELTRT